jgi:hypothetical protein
VREADIAAAEARGRRRLSCAACHRSCRAARQALLTPPERRALGSCENETSPARRIERSRTNALVSTHNL